MLCADGIGTVSYTDSVVSYFVLFATMGVTTYGQREISYVQKSVEDRSVVFWNTKLLEFCTAGILMVAYTIFAFQQDNTTLYLIYGFNIVAVFFDVTWFFQGMEEFGKIVLRNVIFKVISIVYIFAVVKSKDDLILYVIGITVFAVISNISLWFYLPKYINKVDVRLIHPFQNIGTVISLFIPTIAIQIYTVLDKTMIGVITKMSLKMDITNRQ